MSSALNCSCAPPPTDDFIDDYTMASVDERTEISESSSTDSKVLNTPYQRVTPLFRHIEKEDWEAVLSFLNTGKWSTSMFSSYNEHMRSPAPGIQVKTWVTSYDRNGDPEWSQLCLHAAISYAAPFVVIQKIIEFYPKAIQCTDNEGMLPIHLAYGFGAQDNVLALLLEPFPTSINEKGLGGRYPYECCELGPNKNRGKVYKIVIEQTTNRVTSEIDKDWKDFSVAAQDSLGITAKQDVSNMTLHEFLLDLLKDRKELLEGKRAARAAKRSPPRMKGSASWIGSPSHGTPSHGTSSHGTPRPSTTKATTPIVVSSPREYTPTNSETKSLAGPKKKGGRRGAFFGRKHHV
jgi:hypothetical protein